MKWGETHENIIEMVRQIPYSCNWSLLDEKTRDNQKHFYKIYYLEVFV